MSPHAAPAAPPPAAALTPPPADPSVYDVVVVGGGPAGLGAALTLGRALRRTLVVDGGAPRNAPSPAAHNVFTRDGTPPAELLRLARADLAAYPWVTHRAGTVAAAEPAGGGGFAVTLADGARVRSRLVLLASGVVDVLPPVPGLAERWGVSALHCPFCHGTEVAGRPLAVYGRGAGAVEQALLIAGWTRDLALLTDGPAGDGPDGLTPEHRARLAAAGVAVREERVARLDGPGRSLEAVAFADGAALPRAAVFLRAPQRLRGDLAERLGCALTPAGLVAADAEMLTHGRTSVPGVYAAGDGAGRMQQVGAAAADGSAAAATMSRALIAAGVAGAAV
jgi:thioredoxin reductase